MSISRTAVLTQKTDPSGRVYICLLLIQRKLTRLPLAQLTDAPAYLISSTCCARKFCDTVYFRVVEKAPTYLMRAQRLHILLLIAGCRAETVLSSSLRAETRQP